MEKQDQQTQLSVDQSDAARLSQLSNSNYNCLATNIPIVLDGNNREYIWKGKPDELESKEMPNVYDFIYQLKLNRVILGDGVKGLNRVNMELPAKAGTFYTTPIVALDGRNGNDSLVTEIQANLQLTVTDYCKLTLTRGEGPVFFTAEQLIIDPFAGLSYSSDEEEGEEESGDEGNSVSSGPDGDMKAKAFAAKRGSGDVRA